MIHHDIFPRAPLIKLTIGVGTDMLDVCASAPNSSTVFISREDLGLSGGGTAYPGCTNQLGDGLLILKM